MKQELNANKTDKLYKKKVFRKEVQEKGRGEPHV